MLKRISAICLSVLMILQLTSTAFAQPVQSTEYSPESWQYLTHFAPTEDRATKLVFTAAESGYYMIGAVSGSEGGKLGAVALSKVYLKLNDKIAIDLAIGSAQIESLGMTATASGTTTGGNVMNVQADKTGSGLSSSPFAKKYSGGTGNRSSYGIPLNSSAPVPGCVIVEREAEQAATITETYSEDPLAGFKVFTCNDIIYAIKEGGGWVAILNTENGYIDLNMRWSDSGRLQNGVFQGKSSKGCRTVETPPEFTIFAPNGEKGTVPAPTGAFSGNGYYHSRTATIAVGGKGFSIRDGCSSTYNEEGESHSDRYDVPCKNYLTEISAGFVFKYVLPKFGGTEIYIGKDESTIRNIFDTTPPTAPTITKTPSTEWSSTDVTVGIGGSTDVGSGVKKYQYKLGDGAWQDYSTVLTVSATETVSAQAIDGAGNISQSTDEQVKIDKLPPTFSVTGNPTDWTASDVTLTVAATDIGSGLAASAYSFDNGATWQAENSKTFDRNQTVQIVVRDMVENSTASEVSITKIDKDKPTAPTITKTPSADWSSTDVTVGIGGSTDVGSGVKKYQYKLGDGAWQDYSTVLTVSTTETVSAQAIDGAGNISQSTDEQVKIDKLPPTFSVTGNPTAWTANDVTLTVAATDIGSGLHTSAYSFDNGATWQAENSKTFDKNQTVQIVVRDMVGNLSEVKTNDVTYIDKTAPTAPTITKTPSAEWSSTDVTVSIGGSTDVGSGVKKYQYKLDGGAWQDYSTVFTVSATETVSAQAVDGAGNISQSTDEQVKIDKLPPTFSVTGNPTAWTANDVTLTVAATDIGSGLAASAYSFDNGATWQAENIKKIDSNGTFEIVLRDAVGNISTTNTQLVTKIDKLPPTFSVTGNPTDWTASDVTLTVNAYDSLSGLHSKPYSFDNGKTWQSENQSVFDKNQTVQIAVRDSLGTCALVGEVAITKLDKSPPAPPKDDPTALPPDSDTDVLPDNKELAWSAEPTVIETVSGALSGIVKYQVRVQKLQPNSEKSRAVTEPTEWVESDTGKVTINEEGIFTVEVRAVSGAGQVSAASKYVARNDYTMPVIDVSSRGSTLTAVATDELSGIAKIECSHTKAAEEPPTPGITSCPNMRAGEPHEYTATDNAGNVFTITATLKASGNNDDDDNVIVIPPVQPPEKPAPIVTPPYVIGSEGSDSDSHDDDSDIGENSDSSTAMTELLPAKSGKSQDSYRTAMIVTFSLFWVVLLVVIIVKKLAKPKKETSEK